MQVILIIGAVQALFFVILLFNKKSKRLPDKILAIWLVIFALHLSYIYFLFQKGYTTYLEFGGYDTGIIVLYYSLMFIYSKSLITNNNKFKVKWLTHLIPTGVTYISMIPYLLLSYEDKISLFNKKISDNLFFNITAVAIILFITYYIIIIFRLLKKHDLNIKKTYSYDEKINLTWLKKLSLVLAIIWGIFQQLYSIYIIKNSFLIQVQ
ncbi:MAG: hypothetical protein K8R54_19230 [Bacteroidales bacterium]|nr:hypothetical protein [Bacteroidales bacterium]